MNKEKCTPGQDLAGCFKTQVLRSCCKWYCILYLPQYLYDPGITGLCNPVHAWESVSESNLSPFWNQSQYMFSCQVLQLSGCGPCIAVAALCVLLQLFSGQSGKSSGHTAGRSIAYRHGLSVAWLPDSKLTKASMLYSSVTLHLASSLSYHHGYFLLNV